MPYFAVSRSRNLSGNIKIQGSKNLILPLMAVAVLAKGEFVFDNCPDITDVRNTMNILEVIGCKTDFSNSSLMIETEKIDMYDIPQEYSEKMRSSFLFLGALLSRCKIARIPKPGGCNIGKRPIDIHLKAFESMGVIVREEDSIYADAGDLRDAYIRLEFPSVGATENIILLASKSDIDVVIDNAAREPEVREMCNVLNMMGANIHMDFAGKIVIHGVKELKPIKISVMGDRICAGTYMIAVGICGGDVLLEGIGYNEMLGTVEVLGNMGIEISKYNEKNIRVVSRDRLKNINNISTEPFPGFPTDMQSQLMTLASLSEGSLMLYENIFEDRFRIATQLNQMGARIDVKKNIAYIHGVDVLYGSKVKAADLRGGAALLLAGLGAEGTTIVENTEYIKRGYEDIVRDISIVGGNISVI